MKNINEDEAIMYCKRVNYLTMGNATGRLLLIGSRALMLMLPAATAAASGDDAGWPACATTAGRGWNDVAVPLSFGRSMLDAAK